MSSRLDKPRLPLSLGQRPGLSHDVRSDLGYGIAQDKFHKSRKQGAEFPYTVDKHEEVDLEVEEEVLKKILNKYDTPYKSSDHLIGRSADHSARVNGNKPTAIGESTGIAKGLVPFPAMYKKRAQVGGGVNSPTLIQPGQYNRTGTYRGWSHAPIDLEADLSYDEETTEDDMALKKIRKLVRSVLKNNMTEV